LLRNQWRWGCCGVQVVDVGSGVGSMDVSVDGDVVVGEVDGVGDVFVVCDDAVVDGWVVVGAGAPPPLPLASMARP
jgi:hypothetical protein